MDRDRRRFDNESNGNRRMFGNDSYEQGFGMNQDDNGEFDMPFSPQAFVPPTPTPIRRANYQNQQFGEQPSQNFNQPVQQQPIQPQQPAYPGQPTQFTFPYQSQGYANQNDDFNYEFNQNYTKQPIPQDMGRKKKGFFSFMNKKDEMEQIQNMNNVVIVYPKSVTEVSTIIDGLRKGQAIIVDLNKVGEKFAQRTIDYLSGAIYALCGAQQRIGEKMFLFTPNGVSIQGPTDLKKRFGN